MLNFKSSLKALGAASLLGLSAMTFAAPASAQSLADVLKRVQADSNEMTAENQQRLREFQQDKNAQEAKYG
jgi:biopolymer transport protein ExbB